MAFLIWKGRTGRTVVHSSQCPYLSDLKGSKSTCRYPKRLAFGTVDSLISKLRAILADNCSGTDWYSVMGIGNPAACKTAKRYSIDYLQKKLMANWSDSSPSRTRHIVRFEYYRTSHPVMFTGNRFTSSEFYQKTRRFSKGSFSLWTELHSSYSWKWQRSWVFQIIWVS